MLAQGHLEKTIHIGPIFDGGIGSVVQGYIKLLGLPKENAWNSYKNGFVKSLPRLFAICFGILFKKQKNIVCYHIHLASNGSILRKLVIALCLKLKNKKFIIHLHGSKFQRHYTQIILIRALAKTLLRISGAVVCITEQMKNFIEKERLKCRIFVIPNFCETIAENPVDLENRNGEVRIVYAGRYGKRKGVYDLIESFEKAKLDVLVHLDLYGDGEVEKVKDVVKKSAKKDLIAVNGWTKHGEYIEKLPSYDFLVLPSNAEVFPMSILEAMGFGIPVISTYAGGIPEMIENGKNGILFEAGNVDILADALGRLANDRNLRIKLGRNAWVDVRERFSPEIVLEKLGCLYAVLGNAK
jgi:glycosyltransferase involved in cell wall biosynthesis